MDVNAIAAGAASTSKAGVQNALQTEIIKMNAEQAQAMAQLVEQAAQSQKANLASGTGRLVDRNV